MALLLLLGGFVTLIEANVKTSGAEIFEGKGATLKCQPSEAGGSKGNLKHVLQVLKRASECDTLCAQATHMQGNDL